MTRTLLIVNYRSAELTQRSIASARASSPMPLEVVVVDNSCDEAEAYALNQCGADRLIISETNRGYAGGINAGVRAASGDVVIVSNPDITWSVAAIDLLCVTLDDRADIAGPRFSWDEAGEWLLPPADPVTAVSKFSAIAASRSAVASRHRALRRFRRRVAFWEVKQPRRISTLSGAVMAFRRTVLQRVGEFDERFPLYFEETDYLRRATRAGAKIVYQPAARCRHAYNQSAGNDPAARQRFAESEAAYYRKWYGRRVQRVLASMPEPSVRSHAFARVDLPHLSLPGDPPEYVVEASPLPSFDVAAGHFPRLREVVLPPEVAADYRDTHLFMRAVTRRSGKVVAAIEWQRQS